jgi:ADP-ribosylation factor protein 6
MEQPDLKYCKLLVFANKQDLHGVMSPLEVAQGLDLYSFQSWLCIGTCVLTEFGTSEGIKWLRNQFQK